MRFCLPDGHEVDLLDPEEATEAQVRPLRWALQAHATALRPPPRPGGVLPDYSADPADYLGRAEHRRLTVGFQRQAVACCVRSWDYPADPSADTVADLPRRLYQALADACDPIIDALLPRADDDSSPASADLVAAISQSYRDHKLIPLLDLPEWVGEYQRLLELVELTHWPAREIAATPVHVLDRLLAVARGRNKARAEQESAAWDSAAK